MLAPSIVEGYLSTQISKKRFSQEFIILLKISGKFYVYFLEWRERLKTVLDFPL